MQHSPNARFLLALSLAPFPTPGVEPWDFRPLALLRYPLRVDPALMILHVLDGELLWSIGPAFGDYAGPGCQANRRAMGGRIFAEQVDPQFGVTGAMAPAPESCSLFHTSR
jgi:hypothetical protein